MNTEEPLYLTAGFPGEVAKRVTKSHLLKLFQKIPQYYGLFSHKRRQINRVAELCLNAFMSCANYFSKISPIGLFIIGELSLHLNFYWKFTLGKS